MKTKTFTAGANSERDAIKAHVKRVRAKLFRDGAAESVLDRWDDLTAWLLLRDDRYEHKPKGIGK